jgi:hypothetical protein
MPVSREELHPFLKFDPDWVKDDPPWVLEYLDKVQAIQIARIKIEFQRAVNAAYGKALEQIEGVIRSVK